MKNNTDHLSKTKQLHQLHHNSIPLILPNVWDPISALLLTECGYKAVATSSSALAQSLGYPDGEKLPFDLLLNHLKSISEAVDVPVTADVESAYAKTDNELRDHINLLIDTGVAGINYEDSDKQSGELISMDEQVKKIEIIRETADKREVHLFINARIDTYVHADHLDFEQKLPETIKRGKAYEAAGADCVFPILMTDENHIRQLVNSINIPVNIMTFKGVPELKRLSEIGVKRISTGGAYFKYSLNAMKEMAEKLQKLEGLDELLTQTVNSTYINKLIE